MDVLLPAIYSALSGDSDLGDLTSVVRQFRRPQDPKGFRGVLPGVVFRIDDNADERGLHGAATNPEVEVTVHGYGPEAYPECVQAGQRISEIFIAGIPTASGGHTRWGEIVGFQSVDQPDPDAVVLRAVFQCRYWSAGRVAAVADSRTVQMVTAWQSKSSNLNLGFGQTITGLGQSVVLPRMELHRVEFLGTKNGPATGNGIARLYTMSGDLAASTAIPDVLLHSSAQFDVSALPVTPTFAWFECEFTDEPEVDEGQYVVTFEDVDTAITNIQLSFHSTGGHDGILSRNQGGWVASQPEWDLVFRVWGRSV